MPRLAGRIALLALPLLPVLGGQGRARAEEAASDPLQGLAGAAALEIATALAADGMKGRQTGFEGGRRADDYVSQSMAEMGLDPKDAAGAYLEPFEFATARLKAPVTCAIDGKPLAYGSDFREVFGTGPGKIDGEVVFVGYGIAAPAKGFDEYAGADVKGKVVLALRGAPKARAAELAAEAATAAKAALAAERGAKALLFGDVTPTTAPAGPGFRAAIPVLTLSAAAANRLLAGGATLATEQAKREAAEAQEPLPGTGRVALEVGVEPLPRARGHNAMGAIPGADPDFRKELVLVGAHLDGFGQDAEGRPYAGADDNASGVAVLLHVAKTLKENGWRPKRTVLFVVFGASASGHVGAHHVAEGLPFDHDGIVCMLNVERVGQGTPEVALVPAARLPETSARLAAYLPAALAKRVTSAPDPDPSGDHGAFAEKGASAFLLTTKGAHPNVGTTADVAADLKPECLEVAAQVLGRLVLGLGDDAAPFRVK